MVRKHPGTLAKGVVFPQAHISIVSLTAVHESGFELVDHLAILSDLAPSDYYLSKRWKFLLLANSISNDDGLSVIACFLTCYFGVFFDKSHVHTSIRDNIVILEKLILIYTYKFSHA